MNIKELIGENAEIEKKVELEKRKSKDWLKTVSAFANGRGGLMIFGIDNNDNIIGLHDAKEDSEMISEKIKTRIDPIPDFDMQIDIIDDKKIIALEIFSGEKTPYWYYGDGLTQAFVRIGNQSVLATPAQLKDLVLRGSYTSFDSLKSKYDFSDMSFTRLRAVYKQRTGKSFCESDYESFGLVDENGELTNAGALLADDSPIRHSRVFCTRWNGLDKAPGIVDATDDKEFSGGLVNLLIAGTEFVENNSKKAWKKVGDGRIEMPDYPQRAVLEGLVNALIHRNYLEIGSEVHIDMFDDRMEIYSPGGMYDGSIVQERDIMKIPSRRRNPVVADVFHRLKYMDRRGSGFKKIVLDYQMQEGYSEKLKPTFYSDNDAFVLILRNMNYEKMENDETANQDKTSKCPSNVLEMSDNSPINVPEKHEANKRKGSNGQVEKVEKILREKGPIKSKDIAISMGLSIRQVRRILNQIEGIQKSSQQKGRMYWL